MSARHVATNGLLTDEVLQEAGAFPIAEDEGEEDEDDEDEFEFDEYGESCPYTAFATKIFDMFLWCCFLSCCRVGRQYFGTCVCWWTFCVTLHYATVCPEFWSSLIVPVKADRNSQWSEHIAVYNKCIQVSQDTMENLCNHTATTQPPSDALLCRQAKSRTTVHKFDRSHFNDQFCAKQCIAKWWFNHASEKRKVDIHTDTVAANKEAKDWLAYTQVIPSNWKALLTSSLLSSVSCRPNFMLSMRESYQVNPVEAARAVFNLEILRTGPTF